MPDKLANITLHGQGPASPWVQRWSPLIVPGGSVLDIACGAGRHMKWFAESGHTVTGIDRSPESLMAATPYGETILADLENGPWPLSGHRARQFDAVIVTNYLWRPLFPWITKSIAKGGFLIYETFSSGNETVGKPSRPDFLLRSGELLSAFNDLHTMAFEEGFLENPPRFVQRLVACQAQAGGPMDPVPRHTLL